MTCLRLKFGTAKHYAEGRGFSLIAASEVGVQLLLPDSVYFTYLLTEQAYFPKFEVARKNLFFRNVRSAQGGERFLS